MVPSVAGKELMDQVLWLTANALWGFLDAGMCSGAVKDCLLRQRWSMEVPTRMTNEFKGNQ